MIIDSKKYYMVYESEPLTITPREDQTKITDLPRDVIVLIMNWCYPERRKQFHFYRGFVCLNHHFRRMMISVLDGIYTSSLISKSYNINQSIGLRLESRQYEGMFPKLKIYTLYNRSENLYDMYDNKLCKFTPNGRPAKNQTFNSSRNIVIVDDMSNETITCKTTGNYIMSSSNGTSRFYIHTSIDPSNDKLVPISGTYDRDTNYITSDFSGYIDGNHVILKNYHSSRNDFLYSSINGQILQYNKTKQIIHVDIRGYSIIVHYPIIKSEPIHIRYQCCNLERSDTSHDNLITELEIKGQNRDIEILKVTVYTKNRIADEDSYHDDPWVFSETLIGRHIFSVDNSYVIKNMILIPDKIRSMIHSYVSFT
jgi:hypothetical protein